MSKFFDNKRFCWLISAFVCLLCGAAAFIPTVNVADVLGFSEATSGSLVWFLSEAGFPEVYTVILAVYFVFILPLIICGFLKKLRVWPVVVAAVGSIIYFLINMFWGAIILGGSGGYENAVTLSVWGWVYIVLQLATIVGLFVFASKLKRAFA